MLHGGHVSGLEKSGAAGRVFADIVLDSHVHDPGDAQVVHLEREDETIAEIPAVAARQEHGYIRGIESDRETVRRKRARGHSGHLLGAAETQTSQATAHFIRIDDVPTNVWYQRGDILHGADLPSTCFIFN